MGIDPNPNPHLVAANPAFPAVPPHVPPTRPPTRAPRTAPTHPPTRAPSSQWLSNTALFLLCAFPHSLTHSLTHSLSTSSDKIVFSTLSAGEMHTYLLKMDTADASAPRRLLPPGVGEGSCRLLCAHDDVIVVQCSSFISPPTIWACRLSPTADPLTHPQWRELSHLPSAVPLEHQPLAEAARKELSEVLQKEHFLSLPECRTPTFAACPQCIQVRVSRVQLTEAQGGAEAWVLRPAPRAAPTGPAPTRPVATERAAEARSDAPPSAAAAPWLLRPHGGPHSMSPSAFSVELSLLLLQVSPFALTPARP